MDLADRIEGVVAGLMLKLGGDTLAFSDLEIRELSRAWRVDIQHDDNRGMTLIRLRRSRGLPEFYSSVDPALDRYVPPTESLRRDAEAKALAALQQETTVLQQKLAALGIDTKEEIDKKVLDRLLKDANTPAPRAEPSRFSGLPTGNERVRIADVD